MLDFGAYPCPILYSGHLWCSVALHSLCEPSARQQHSQTQTWLFHEIVELRARSRVENSLGLAEFGDAWTEFYSSIDGLPVARGYDRIVYGDHGPYVDACSDALVMDSFRTDIFLLDL